jgi:EpsI family protein
VLSVGQVHYARLIGPDGVVFHLWHWYRIGEQVEDNDYLATLRIAWRRFSQGVDDGAHIVIAVPGEDRATARALADRFIADNEVSIDGAIDEAFKVKE